MSEQKFKFSIGDKVMGLDSLAEPIGGTITDINTFGTKIHKINVYKILCNNDKKIGSLIEQDAIPFDGLKWHQAMIFWEESKNYMKKVNEKKQMCFKLLSNKCE